MLQETRGRTTQLGKTRWTQRTQSSVCCVQSLSISTFSLITYGSTGNKKRARPKLPEDQLSQGYFVLTPYYAHIQTIRRRLRQKVEKPSLRSRLPSRMEPRGKARYPVQTAALLYTFYSLEIRFK